MGLRFDSQKKEKIEFLALMIKYLCITITHLCIVEVLFTGMAYSQFSCSWTVGAKNLISTK